MPYTLSRRAAKIAAELTRGASHHQGSYEKFLEAQERATSALDGGERLTLGSRLAADVSYVLSHGANANQSATQDARADLLRNLRGLPHMGDTASTAAALAAPGALVAVAGFMTASSGPVSLATIGVIVGLSGFACAFISFAFVGPALRRRHPASAHGMTSARKVRHEARFDGVCAEDFAA